MNNTEHEAQEADPFDDLQWGRCDSPILSRSNSPATPQFSPMGDFPMATPPDSPIISPDKTVIQSESHVLRKSQSPAPPPFSPIGDDAIVEDPDNRIPDAVDVPVGHKTSRVPANELTDFQKTPRSGPWTPAGLPLHQELMTNC